MGDAERTLYSNFKDMNRLTGLVKGKCPKCGEGEVFVTPPSAFSFRMPEMHSECSHCHHVFEKESGFFWGAMYVSYALTLAESAVIFLLAQLVFKETFDERIIWIIVAAVVLLIRFNFRFSRMIWMYIFTSKEMDL